MTHKFPRIALNVRVAEPTLEPLYSVFEKTWEGDYKTHNWKQIGLALPLKSCLKVYGNMAVRNPQSYEIRKAKLELPQACKHGNRFRGPQFNTGIRWAAPKRLDTNRTTAVD